MSNVENNEKKGPTIVELKEFSDNHFKLFSPKLSIPETKALIWLSKITEELGELSEALTAEMGLQRNKYKEYDVGEEIADVIIASMLLAVELGMDPYELVNKKFSKLVKRQEKLVKERFIH